MLLESSQALPAFISVFLQFPGKKKGTGKDYLANPHMNHCIGRVWQGFGGRKVVGVTPVRKGWGLPHDGYSQLQ